MSSVYSNEFINRETYFKRSLILLTIMFRLFILIAENILRTAFLYITFFLGINPMFSWNVLKF